MGIDSGDVVSVTIVIGNLRQTATLANPGTPTADGDGGFTQTYAPLNPATWRCEVIKAGSGRTSERHFSDTVLSHASYIFSGRFHPGITTTTQITWTDRSGAVHVGNVLDVDDTEGAGVETVIAVSEVVT